MNKKLKKYSQAFYLRHRNLTSSSAKKILDLFPRNYNPDKIIDIGCGTGEWLNIFCKKYSGLKVTGVDGSWVNKENLLFDSKDFVVADLNNGLPDSIMKNRYDMVVCLEAITDLPENVGKKIINQICSITTLCLFSSGTPIQTHKPHINRQWQSYWHKLFQEQNFVALDCIRPAIWEDSEVGSWYKQNCFLFVFQPWFDEKNNDFFEGKFTKPFPVDVVHPSLIPPSLYSIGLKQWIKILPKVIFNTFSNLILK